MSVTRNTSTAAQTLAAALKPRLRPLTAAVAKPCLAALVREEGRWGLPEILKGATGRFIAAVMACSPFLRDLMADEPQRLEALLATDPQKRLTAIVNATAAAWRNSNETELMAKLRRARQEVALLTALADLGGVWDVAAVTAALTRFGDAAVSAAVRFILARAAEAGEIEVADTRRPDAQSGWIILAMGKFGASELNYSSDIDLIVLFDRTVIRVCGERDPTTVFVKLTKRLVAILNERTADGYVFRTDLRLRPDPGTTNIAMSTDAALQYYESLGQNWERAALIKARPVAGDKAAGEAFLAELTPYIWRKYLDYAAIADIHSIKRQIRDHRGHEEIAVAGHNIKLGTGGIREIEFFVQTQQLIAGGRDPALRGRGTLPMLAALAKGGWIDAEARNDMAAAYRHLRMIEHCLQMVADAQTHTLPQDEEELAAVARMAGYAGVAEFGSALVATLTTVRDRYAALFETAPTLGAGGGSLVFTGDTDDPDTLATLSRLGYARPGEVTRVVRGWHYGRYPATRSASARERLNDFVPLLIEQVAHRENPDAVFAAFDRFFARMPAGVQLFAILQSNPQLLDLLATILDTAPRLAETVVHRAHVLDALIEPAFFGSLPERAMLESRLAASLDEAASFEDLLDRARIFGQEQSFLIGVRVLAGTVSVRNAGYAYSDVADVLIAALLAAVRAEFEKAHGRMKGGEVALVAMGRLGGREMTAASDLDLLLLYDFDEAEPTSDGDRPLAGALYFARLTQRMVAALSAPTAEGSLYPVDFRLRPSGNSGPVATHIDSFAAYQAKDAWTWEHMALTRARPVAGDPRLLDRTRKEIAKIIARRRAADRIIADVIEMRGMVEEAKGGGGPWDLKQTPGGLVDIEFIAQTLQLLHAGKHPSIVATETEVALGAAADAGLVSPADAEVLLPALRLYQSLIQMLRLTSDGVFDPAHAPRALLARLARTADLPAFAQLDAHVRASEEAVRGVFQRIIGGAGEDRAG